jgi:hypothetical protein
LVDHVGRRVSIGIDNELGACSLCKTGHMAIGEAVTAAGAELQGYAIGCSQRCLLLGDETRVGQDVYRRALDGGAVRACSYWLYRRFTMDNDQSRTEPASPPGQGRNLGGRYVGDLDAGKEGYLKPVGASSLEKAHKLPDQFIQVGGVGVVGDGQCAIPYDLDAA